MKLNRKHTRRVAATLIAALVLNLAGIALQPIPAQAKCKQWYHGKCMHVICPAGKTPWYTDARGWTCKTVRR